MSKQSSHIVNTGQLDGANLKIEAVHNDGLQESVTIINQGTVIQPMSGWVLASLRGQALYPFPDDLLLRPSMNVMVHSGRQEPQKALTHQTARVDLLWTTDQIWNNHGDIAILFDANGQEIDRYSYPHERVMGSSANRRKVLLRNPKRESGLSHDNSYEIVDQTLRREKKVTRKQSGALAGQS